MRALLYARVWPLVFCPAFNVFICELGILKLNPAAEIIRRHIKTTIRIRVKCLLNFSVYKNPKYFFIYVPCPN